MRTSNKQSRDWSFTFGEAAAFTLVLWFGEVIVSMLTWTPLIHAGLQTWSARAVVRVIACGLIFTTFAHIRQIPQREILHHGPASAMTTLGVLTLPILLLLPLLLLLDGLTASLLELVFPMSSSAAKFWEELSQGNLGMWVLVCLIAPMVEEMFFRGVLLRGLLNRYARADATVYSAFLFGLIHLNVYQFVIAFLLGLLLAALYCRTRSLWPGILLHAGINTGVMVTMASGIKEMAAQAPLMVWVAASLLAAVGAHFLRKLLREVPAIAAT
ncbi:membrane-associated amino terminal protease [Cupriavidus sp. UYMU48A]|nr:membrane-associated amino terminal protease [Cupriavidus sp. UYMU48A]